MIERFIMRHRRRRRIARVIRLVNVTALMLPTVMNIVSQVTTVYVRAWKGDHANTVEHR